MVLGIALLAAPRLQSFKYADQRWSPKGNRFGKRYIFPLTIVYIIANLFVFVVIWFPSSLQNMLHTRESVVAPWVGPLVGTACFATGAAFWMWDRYGLRLLGYELEPLQERIDGMTVHITFQVSVSVD